MKVATVSLNYYTQNNEAACELAGRRVHENRIHIAGFTEVRSAAMMEGLSKGLGRTYSLIAHQESPQAFKHNKWRLVSHRVEKGTPGKAEVTPTLFFIIATYRKAKNHAKILEVVSTHAVPLTKDGRRRPDYDMRIEMWNHHWDVLKHIVDSAVNKRHSIIVIGDFNNLGASKQKIKDLHPKAKWIIRHGLDWVFAVEGNVRIKKAGLIHNFDSGSDHKACWRRVVCI